MNKPMKNTIVASLQFDFRGNSFNPVISVDLDVLMQRQGELNDLYDMLAVSIGLDAYRHEYDVMVMQEIIFSEPFGLVSDFVTAGKLNFDAFIEAWKKQKALKAIQPIARKYLDISDLDQHPDIRSALLESYLSGKKTIQNKEKLQSPACF